MARKDRSAPASAPPAGAPAGTGSPEAALASQLMRRQALLAARVAAVFLVLVLGLPLLTHFAPELSQQPVLGFPLSWFVLGILFYPLTWGLSAYFVKASEKLEAEEAEIVRRHGLAGKGKDRKETKRR